MVFISVNNDDSNSLNKSKPKPKIQFIQSNLDYKNILESRKKIPPPNYITKNKVGFQNFICILNIFQFYK